MSGDPTLTPAQSEGCLVRVRCPNCRDFRSLDILAFRVAGRADVPWSKLFSKMRCETCKGAPDHLWVGIDDPFRPVTKYAVTVL